MPRALSALIIIAACCAPPALAKLPALSDEAKAKAAAAASKTAWTDKVSAYQLCRAMDRTAEVYRKSAKASGKAPPAAVETPACADPGPFVEAATMAGAPVPNSKAAAAGVRGQKKK
jgi:hypothetical protein